MTTQNSIDEFLNCKNIAVVGVSRKNSKFGNAIYKELKNKGFNTYGVNPNMDKIKEDKCYKNLKELEGKIDGVITCVSPAQTKKIAVEANEIGVTNIWMQQGSESEEAIQYCIDNQMNEIHKECVLMFADPVSSIHGFHRWIWKVLGKLPN